MERQLHKNYFAIGSAPTMGVSTVCVGQGSFYVLSMKYEL